VARFPSTEWAELARVAINASPDYLAAAKAWEGDIVLRIVSEDPTAPAPGIFLDLDHGVCRASSFLPDSRDSASEFAFEATRGEWERILRKETDPVREVLSGRVKVRGNFAKAMRFTKATTLLVEIASGIPTEF
jgi:putative sterol carrier protein